MASHSKPAENMAGTDDGWSRIARFLRRVPKQDRARAVVDAILQGADEALDEAEGGPLRPILHRAGVAAGSFYEYFGSRQALLGAVVERVTQHNLERFLGEIDEILADDSVELEHAVRATAEWIARTYLERPAYLQRIIRVADRLGLLGHVSEERDRFATAAAARLASRTPTLSEKQRVAAVQAMADAGLGIVVLSLFRTPVPPTDDIALATSDVVWSVLRLHLERAERR